MDTTPHRSPLDLDAPLNYELFLMGMGQMTPNLRMRSTTEESADGVLTGWWRVLHGEIDPESAPTLIREWLSNQIFDQAVQHTLETTSGFLPEPADFLETCRSVRQRIERDKRPALPPPALRPALPRAGLMAREVMRGRLRARKRFALIAEYRLERGLHRHFPAPESVWRGLDEPTEAEIDAALAERGVTPTDEAHIGTAALAVINELPTSVPSQTWPAHP